MIIFGSLPALSTKGRSYDRPDMAAVDRQIAQLRANLSKPVKPKAAAAPRSAPKVGLVDLYEAAAKNLCGFPVTVEVTDNLPPGVAGNAHVPTYKKGDCEYRIRIHSVLDESQALSTFLHEVGHLTNHGYNDLYDEAGADFWRDWYLNMGRQRVNQLGWNNSPRDILTSLCLEA